MEKRAQQKYIMIGPRKARRVADQIRTKTVDYALFFLGAMRNRQKAVDPIEKTLKSAVANFAVEQPNIDTEKLFVKEILVDCGPVQKRIRPRAQGRAYRRLKRTSHITIVISD
jgi:large subunit ribosomal protein L22